MSSSETEARTLASLTGSRDTTRVLRLVSELGKALSSQIQDGKARLVHPSQVALVAAASGEESIGEIKSLVLAGADAAKDPALDFAAAYVAPEVFAGKPEPVASTVYHVAALAYHLLTGQAPFEGSTPAAIRIKVLLERPPSPRSVRPELPPAFEQVLLQALDKKPEARPSSLEDLVAQLVMLLAATAPSADLSLRSTRGGSPALIALLALVGFLAAAAGLMLHSSREAAPAASATFIASGGSRSTRRAAPSAEPAKPMPASPGAAAPGGAAPPPAPPPPPAPAAQAERAAPPRKLRSTPQTIARDDAAPTAPATRKTAAPARSKPAAPMMRGRAAEQSDDEVGMPSAGQAEKKVADSVAKSGAKKKPAAPRKEKGGRASTEIGADIAQSPMKPPATAGAAEPVAAAARGPLPEQEEASSTDASASHTDARMPPRLNQQKERLGILLLGIAFLAAVGAGFLLWFIRRDRLFALQHAKTQRSSSEADTVPTTKTEEAKSSKGAIDPFTVGQYTCFARLGEGGMGMVYKARHTQLDREAAVKVLSPSAMIAPDAIDLFQREARLASQINHPNSVFIYDYGNVSGALFYLVMEFIDGQSLDEIISPKGKPPRPLTIPRVLTLTRQICDVLDTAHGQGIVHRDLKPHNVMVLDRVDRPDFVKVVDFGIARSMDAAPGRQTASGALIGTPAYMSPEQAAGDPTIDTRSDIFSLAVMVFHMLSGKIPFADKAKTPIEQLVQRATMREPLGRGTLRAEGNITPEIEAVLLRALDPDRTRRPQTAGEFYRELAKAAA